MQLYARDGKWHATSYYWDERTARRKRWRRSTGIAADGTARSKRIAEQSAHQIAQSYASGAVRRARPLTLEAAIKLHVVAHERAQSAQATIDIVTEKAAALFAHFGPSYDVAALSNASLAEYADARRKQPGRHKGTTVSTGTVHRELLTLIGALKDARRAGKLDGLLPEMPELGTVYTPRARWLPTAQSKALLLAVIPRWRDHVVMLRQLGLDEGELYAIERGDVDTQRRELRVRGTKTRARLRVMPLGPEVFEILERRAKQPGPLFEPWRNNNRDLALACEKASIERCCLKDLRRSFATELAIAGVPLLHLMALMGHSTGRMLELVYARVERGQHLHDAVRHLAELRPVAGAQGREAGR